MTPTWRTAACAAVVLATLASVRASDDKPSDVLEAVYGERIRRAARTPSEADDLDLARDLLIAANDTSYDEPLRLRLARAAFDVAAEMTSRAGQVLLERSVETADQIKPLSEARRAYCRSVVASGRLRRVKADPDALPDEITRSAEAAARAHLAFVQAVWGESDLMPEARASMTAATRLLQRHELVHLADDVNHGQRLLRRAGARDRLLERVLERIEAARNSPDPNALLAPRAKLVDIYLTFDGDIASARQVVEGTGHSEQQTILDAHTFLTGSELLDSNTLLRTASRLVLLGKRAGPPASRRLGGLAERMARLVAKGARGQAHRLRAKALLSEAMKLAETDPASVLLRRIRRETGGVYGQFVLLPDGQVRLGYDFSSSVQLRDWSGPVNQWGVRKRSLVCLPSGQSTCQTQHKLRFRADEPLRIKFRCVGRYRLGVTVQAVNTQDARACHWNLYASSSSAYAYAHGQSDRCDGLKLQPGQPQAWEVTIDPKGQSTWKVDGKTVAKLRAPRVGPDELGKLGLSVTLLGYGMRSEATEAYDDVAITGTPMLPEDDDEDPPAQGDDNAPADQPAVDRRIERLRNLQRRLDARPGRGR